MQPRSLSLATLSAAPVSIGAVLVDLAAETAATPPEWIKLAPRGAVKTRDGRQYQFAPEDLAARFAADGIDLPIDVDHAVSKASFSSSTAPAVGWIKELQARPDGLYGRVDWLDTGKALLAARSHRYISPSFPHDDLGKATWIHSASLVAAPALPNMPALASADPQKEPQTMKTILVALGLQPTASEAEGLAALTALQGKIVDPAAVVSKAVHDAALAQLAAATTKLTTIETETRGREVAGVIDAALTAKKIVPAQKDHYLALCSTDAGFAQVKAMLAVTPAILGASGLDNKDPAKGGGGELSAEQLAVCSALGINPEDYKKTLAVA
jgi:phage I-like protein